MIVVFGALNIDMMMPVGHFPRPGETVLCTADYLSRPGGKGANQAVAACRAGAKVAVVGMVGDDSFGRRAINNLKSQSILTTGIGVSDRPTGCSTIAVDMQGENVVITAPGANMEAAADQVPDEILTPKNIVLAQLEVTPHETFTVLQRAHARGAVTVLNPSPARHMTAESFRGIDYLIVNEIESHQLAQNLGITDLNPTFLANAISKIGKLACIITLEERGSVAARDGVVYKVPTLDLKAIDATGAGDAFCGIFAACLQQGHNWLAALHRASTGAALSCVGLGAQDGMPFMEDIEKNLRDVPAPSPL